MARSCCRVGKDEAFVRTKLSSTSVPSEMVVRWSAILSTPSRSASERCSTPIEEVRFAPSENFVPSESTNASRSSPEDLQQFPSVLGSFCEARPSRNHFASAQDPTTPTDGPIQTLPSFLNFIVHLPHFTETVSVASKATMSTSRVEPNMRGVLPHSVGGHPVHAGHRLAISPHAHSSFGIFPAGIRLDDHHFELWHGIAVGGSPQHQRFGQLVQIDRGGKVDVREATASADDTHQLAIQVKKSPTRVTTIEWSVQTEPWSYPILDATNTYWSTLT